MNINIWLVICLVLVTAAIIAVAVYMILALLQIRNTAKEMEAALSKVNSELETVGKVSDKVLNLTGKLANPVVSAASILFYVLSNIKSRKKNRCKEEENVR